VSFVVGIGGVLVGSLIVSKPSYLCIWYIQMAISSVINKKYIYSFNY